MSRRVIPMVGRNWMARQMSFTDDFETHRYLSYKQSVLFYGHPSSSTGVFGTGIFGDHRDAVYFFLNVSTCWKCKNALGDLVKKTSCGQWDF